MSVDIDRMEREVHQMRVRFAPDCHIPPSNQPTASNSIEDDDTIQANSHAKTSSDACLQFTQIDSQSAFKAVPNTPGCIESPRKGNDTFSQDEFYFASDLVEGDIDTSIEPKRSIYELFQTAKDTIQAPFDYEEHDGRFNENCEAPNRLEILAEPRTKFFAENQKQRLVKEAEMLGECTFQPNLECLGRRERSTSAEKQSIARYEWLPKPKNAPKDSNKRRTSAQNACERLHLDSSLRYELRDQAKQQMDDFNLRQECTFAPSINPISKNIAQPPLYERIPNMRRQKDAKLDQLRREVDQESRECTFHPTISVMSRKLAQSQDDLHRPRDSRSRQKCLKTLSKMETFHPRINDASKKLIRHKPEFQLDFVTRQAYFQHSERQERSLNTKCKVKTFPSDLKCTFTPDIGNADAVLRKLRPERAQEHIDDQVYRMTYNEPKERRARAQQLREETSQFSFKPSLNSVSKSLGKSTPLEDLSRPNTLKMIRLDGWDPYEVSQAPIPPKKERGLSQPGSLWQSEKLLQAIDADRLRRETDLEARRQERAVEEMKECTFRPKLATPKLPIAKASSERPIIVRGLERFMESRELARLKEKQQQEREYRVFFTNYKPRKYTIPKPFHLSHSIRKRSK
uniref:Uncharacterized protein AlNc14C150G7511 n=1 Tax=Albugo laibachii Nc14 TaxID=890382 RepID=F0WLZ8_9STRA|nr:hypothetical protein PITG_16471 [Albugo laibachii Nc14]|eukprot:CCA22325.1 hypothetical protein PITG_16471 [Albugo laibachii Nc14]